VRYPPKPSSVLNNMSSFKITRQLIRYAIPICFVGLLNVLASASAALFISQLGKEVFAANSISFSIYIAISTITSTMLYSVGILSRYQLSQGRLSDVGLTIRNGLWLALFLGIPSSFLLWNIPHVLLFFHQDPRLVSPTISYFHFTAFNLIPLLINIIRSQFYISIGKPKVPLIFNALQLPLTILLSYGLILGRLGLPKMGLAGAACSSFITSTLVFLMLSLWFWLDKNNRKYMPPFRRPYIQWEFCKKLLKLGAPMGVQFGTELAAIAVTNLSMSGFGLSALNATQIMSQYINITVIITLGVAQALSILTSGAYAKNDFALIHKYKWAAIILLSIFFLFVGILFLIFPKVLVAPYVDIHDPRNLSLIHLTIIFFLLSVPTFWMDGIRNILSGILRGLQQSQTPMWIGIVCLWGISLPMAYLLSHTFQQGPVGLRVGFACGFVIATILLWVKVQKRLSRDTQSPPLPSLEPVDTSLS
jgi:MATE family multidrug resistance protein